MSTSAEIGTLVAGRYRLRSLLGQGGMGRVWAAHDEVLEREVAVKEVLLPPAVPDGEREALLARTLREGRAAARVRHPRVVTVYDVVEDDERPWLVLQLLEPRTLADVLAAEGPLDPHRAALIGLQLLEGLSEVHAAGVLHRDVKPANVLFGPDGAAVLADFGVATLEDDAAVTSTGLILGSPAYLAPERARGEAPTSAADLWSLGATLFAAVEGHSPFHREGPLPTLGALLTEGVPAAPSAGPLAPAIAALLTKDPAARPGADAVRRLLTAALTGTSVLPAARRAAVPLRQEDTAPMALPFAAEPFVREPLVPASRGHEAWEVPPVEPARRTIAPATVLPAPAAGVPAPRRRRRALVAVAAAALLAGPVTALAEHHRPAVTDGPASAGTALFSTTPQTTANSPAVSKAPGTAVRRTSATSAAGHSATPATRPAGASLPHPASRSTRESAPAPVAAAPTTASANTAQPAAQGAGDGNGKGKDKHKKGDGDNGGGNSNGGNGGDNGGGNGNGGGDNGGDNGGGDNGGNGDNQA